VALPSGAPHIFPIPSENAAPLLVEIRPERSGGSRVNLEVRLREKNAPETDLASVSVSGEIGKTFIVGGRPLDSELRRDLGGVLSLGEVEVGDRALPLG
jgi:hypothetical protein